MSQQPPNPPQGDGQPYNPEWQPGQTPPPGYQPPQPPPGQYPQQGYPPQGGYYQPQQPPPGQYSPPGQYPPQQGYAPQQQYPPQGYAPQQYPPQTVVVNQKGANPLLIILAIVGGLMVAGCIGVFLILGAAGNAVNQVVKDTGTGQTVKGKSGETLSNSGWGFTVNNTEKNTTGYQSTKPTAGNVYFSVEISVGSTDGKHQADSNIFYTKLKDSAGHIYTPSLFGKTPELGSQSDISQGQNVRGWVTFEVPSSASGFTLIYEPILGPKFEVAL